MQQALTPAKKSHASLILVLMLLIALGPILFAWGIYNNSDSFEFNTEHTGDLITPALLATSLQYTDLHGATFTGEEMRGRWWITYVAPSHCDAACGEWLHQMRQIHVALGKNSDRVGRLFLAESAENMPMTLADEYPNLTMASLDKADRLYYFLAYATPGVTESGALYLIDPQGHVILHYPASTAPSGILDDIRRLLRISQIG